MKVDIDDLQQAWINEKYIYIYINNGNKNQKAQVWNKQ